MSDEVRIGSLRLKFLIDDAENGGKLTMFDMTVPEQAKVPAIACVRRFRPGQAQQQIPPIRLHQRVCALYLDRFAGRRD